MQTLIDSKRPRPRLPALRAHSQSGRAFVFRAGQRDHSGPAHRDQFLVPAASGFPVAVYVVGQDAGVFGGHRQPILVPQGALGVLMAALPMLPH